jgi:glycosyltransferase involved in cell wall biosynthesis
MLRLPSETFGQLKPAGLTCSVVVCTRDRPEALDECLAAVSAVTPSASEIIVIDSAPRNANAEKTAERWGARYILETRPGLSRARNRAAHESTSDILAFIDDDAVPEPGWLEPLLAEFEDPKVALVAGRVLPPDSDKEMLPIYAWFGVVDLGPERKVFDRSVSGWYGLTNFGGVGLGANISVRRSVFNAWHGFDERLGAGTRIPGHEELKAFFELVELGFRLVYAPRSVVRHAFPRSMEELRRRGLRAVEASAAYLTLLLFEQPFYRKETWDYIKGKIVRIKPLFRRETTGCSPLAPGYRILLARGKGILLYFATRLTQTRQVY